jgi:hypothetical protein
MANDLIALIKQKQDAIAKLEAELAEARAMLLRTPSQQGANTRAEAGGIRTKKVAGRRSSRGNRRGAGRPVSRRVGVPGIQPTSSVGLTVEVLRQAAKPLHVTDIIRGIEGKGQKVSKTTLIGNLSRYVQKKRIFFRAGPNVFGLLELRKAS